MCPKIIKGRREPAVGAGSAGGTGARCALQPPSRSGLPRGPRRGRGAEGWSPGRGGRLRSCARTRRQPSVGSRGKVAPGHCPPARRLFPRRRRDCALRGSCPGSPSPPALGGSALGAGHPGRPREAGGARLASAIPRTLMAWVWVRRLRLPAAGCGARSSPPAGVSRRAWGAVDQCPPAQGAIRERFRPGLSLGVGEPRRGQC